MKNVRDIIKVLASNLCTIISGLFIGFILPKLLSIEGYGYYKIYSLYLSYIGMFSIGIIDGIVMKYGNKDYEELDINTFRTYFTIYSFIQIVFSIMIFGISVLFLKRDYLIIGIYISLELIVINITGYYQQISQITQRFNEYSARSILKSIFITSLILIMFIISQAFNIEINYKLYLLLLLLIDIILCIWYILSYKSLSQFKFDLSKIIEMKNICKLGFPLLVANFCSSMILLIDRQFVSLLFSTQDYAIYAFAYSVISLIIIAISSVSTVLYPMISRYKTESLKEKYKDLQSLILILSIGCLCLYYPLKEIILFFLPQYKESIIILAIIFPSIVYNSLISIIISNFYKRFQLTNVYFIQTIFVLLLSIIANIIVYIYYRSYVAISFVSIIIMFIWYCLSKFYLDKKFHIESKKTITYLAVINMLFYCNVFLIKNSLLSLFAFILEYISILFIFERIFVLKVMKKYWKFK